MPGLTDRIEAAGREVLDRRLDPASAAPLAVGFSGGADSLLTLLTAKAWASRHGRPLLVLTVDHRLQAESAAWTRRCGEVCVRLGLPFRALSWEGPKPATGLPAAARAARHRLLAQAARAAGARVLLLGHTGSDVAEGELMRAEGANIGRLREWAPSPAWPEGRGLFCLRPLLALSRPQARERLAAAGWTWIDDPANENPQFARSRARRALAEAGSARAPQGAAGRDDDDQIEAMARRVRFGAAGFAQAPADIASSPALPRLLQLLLLCVSGGETPARGARVEALGKALPPAATLGGCRVIRRGADILLARELGRRAPPPLELPQNEPAVWDGRFEITAQAAGLCVRPLKGRAARLRAAERRALRSLPAAARPSLPVIVARGDESATCPFLADAPPVRIRALAAARFAGACGLIAHEAAI